METSQIFNKELVLLGGGHSHLSVLRMFGMKPAPGVRVTLISRDIHTPYSGMLPGYIAGHYTYDECHIDLAMLAQWAGARFIHAEADGLNLKKQEVLLKDRPPVRYDVLSINLGITPDMHALPGAAKYATPVKPIFSFVERFQQLLTRSQSLDSAPRIAVIGGGAGGVEVALALAYRLERERREKGLPDCRKAHISLVTRGSLLAAQPPYAATSVRPFLISSGIQVHEGEGAKALEEGRVLMHNGSEVPVDEVLLCTQAAAPRWLKQTQLPLDEQGFISISDTLQLQGGPSNVFACGDVATSVTHPRPKAGVYAVRQGPPLADNIRAFLSGQELRPFVPQTTFLSLITTGGRHAVGTKGNWLGIQGGWVWNLKDWIDRSFMHRFGRDLPEMSMQQTPAQQQPAGGDADLAHLQRRAAMRCAGCGSKVAATSLSRVLQQLPRLPRAGAGSPGAPVLVGLDSPDDAAVLQPPSPGHVMLQTVDFMRSFVSDPYVFGAVVANHCLADCYAMGGSPSCALAIVGLPFSASRQVESDLSMVLHGAIAVLHAAGCELVGGHTCENRDLCFGLSVTGSVEQNQLLRKSGLQVGQALVLTKALGSGLLLAAAMQRTTKGRYLQGALDSMLLPNAPALQLMLRYGVSACTDVTGFGLLGHAGEMAEASQVGVIIDASAVPLLPGAQEASQAGVRSSLHDDNCELASARLTGQYDKELLNRNPELVDPQTSGGLLAGVPASSAQELVAALRAAGYVAAAVVGKVVAGAGDVEVQ